MTEKLNYSIVTYKVILECQYCFTEFPVGTEFIQITTRSMDILKFFRRVGKVKPQSVRSVRLCPKCFNRFHDLLEECENQDYQVLGDD